MGRVDGRKGCIPWPPLPVFGPEMTSFRVPNDRSHRLEGLLFAFGSSL